MSDLSFAHVHQTASGAERRTLLLLHDIGGNERDMATLARLLLPEAGVLSPRGQVPGRDGIRFFRRLQAGVYDMEDLPRRAAQLAAFVAEAAAHYGFDKAQVVAVGVGEGADMASTLMLAWPDTLAAMVIFRGGAPLMPDRMPKLAGRPVLVSNGRHDPIAAPVDTEQLVALLRAAGADVTVAWRDAGRQLTRSDVEGANAWLTCGSSLRSPAPTS